MQVGVGPSSLFLNCETRPWMLHSFSLGFCPVTPLWKRVNCPSGGEMCISEAITRRTFHIPQSHKDMPITHLLFPHRIGCSPAHSCTNAENWEWGFTASSFPFPSPAFPPPSAPSSPSSPDISVALRPEVVVLRGKVMFVGEAGDRPVQAPLGNKRARPESKSTSLRSLSTSARSFNKAPRWDCERGTTDLGCSRWSWWDERGEENKELVSVLQSCSR